MDNSKDLTKVLEGLKSAESILNNMITPEILEQMTPEQREELEDAKKGIDNKAIQKASEKLEKFVNTL
jgi:hypothetical protein